MQVDAPVAMIVAGRAVDAAVEDPADGGVRPRFEDAAAVGVELV